MGLCAVLHHTLASGAAVVTLARLGLEPMLAAMEAHEIAHALVPPSLLAVFAHLPLAERFDLTALRTLGCGGAPGARRTGRGGRRAAGVRGRPRLRHVAPYKRLHAIELRDELPRSPTGKLLRRVLRER